MQTTIGVGTRIHPAAEHGTNGTPQLFARILGEWLAQFGFDFFLECLDDFGPVICAHVGIKGNTLVFLDGLKDVFKVIMINAQNDVTIHLNEAAVTVIGKTTVA